jgi:plasmid stabilization system protein ParE
MNRYVLAPAARHDLQEIQAYIAQNNVQAARKVIAELKAAFDRLADNPRLGHPREDITDQPVLFWPVHAYSVIYRPHVKPLAIVRVLHSARDIPNLL